MTATVRAREEKKKVDGVEESGNWNTLAIKNSCGSLRGYDSRSFYATTAARFKQSSLLADYLW